MTRLKSAFTLIELLVVIAIIAILAAILFPVFAQAKDSAKKTVDLSNMKQHVLGVLIYTNDSDDYAPVWMYNGTFDVKQGDRSWGNLMYPYTKSADMYKTPNSPFGIHTREYDPTTGFPIPTGSSQHDQELYNLGWLTDYGYNYQGFTGFEGSATGFQFEPIAMTSAVTPANTLLLVTGVFNRDAGGGIQNGGQLPIDPPCLFNADGSTTTVNNVNNPYGWYYYGGWNPSQPLSWYVFGGVWPYYTGGGTNNAARGAVGFTDGHAKTLTVPQIAAGCNVKDNSSGMVTDRSKYLWETTK